MPRVKAIPVKRSSHRFDNNSYQYEAIPHLILSGEEDESVLEDDESSKEPPSKISASFININEEWVCCTSLPESASHKESTLIPNWGKYQDCSSNIDWLCVGFQTILNKSLKKMKGLYLNHHSNGLFILFEDSSVLFPNISLVNSRTLLKGISEDKFRIRIKISLDVIEVHFFVYSNNHYIPPSLLKWTYGQHFSHHSWYDGSLSPFNPNIMQLLNTLSARKEINEFVLNEVKCELKQCGVVTELRPYQLEGVCWMWQRLTVTIYSQAVSNIGWVSMKSIDKNENEYAYNPLDGKIIRKCMLQPMQLPHSCILADEMGIGKSLQIISLILLFKKRYPSTTASTGGFPHQDNKKIEILKYFSDLKTKVVINDRSVPLKTRRNCQHGVEESPCFCGRADLRNADVGWIHCKACQRRRHLKCCGFIVPPEDSMIENFVCFSCSCLYYYQFPILSAATLIIMPNTLLNQWQMEIAKHLSVALKVLVYKGHEPSAKGPPLSSLSPEELVNKDIILMSFKTLKSCFHEANIDWTERSNNHGKYDIFPPPILGVRFNLLVVDETQNIEGSTENHIIKMANKLRAVRKVSVSGTPFATNSAHDLLSLLQFLEIPPFHANASAWKELMDRPQIPVLQDVKVNWLKDLFGEILLRRTKLLVHDQLQLLSGFTLLRPLQFSTFEMALYSDNLSTIMKELSENVSHELLGVGKTKIALLRKGCCHPQILDKSLRYRSNISASGALPLNQVMVMKVEQTKRKCEEAQRDFLFYLFKMAGLQLLKAQTRELSPQQANHLLLAVLIYSLAHGTVEANREACPLVSLIQLHGNDWLDDSQCVIPFVSESTLNWLPPITIFSESQTDKDQQRVKHYDGLSKVHWFKSEDVPLPLVPSGGNAQSPWPSAEIPYAKLLFSHSKTIIDFEVVTCMEMVQEIIAGQSSTEHSDFNGISFILFPAKVSLLTSDNSTDAYVEILTKTVGLSIDDDSIHTSAPAVTSEIGGSRRRVRSKNWKLEVRELQSVCLVVKSVASHPRELGWASIEDMKRFIALSDNPSSASTPPSTEVKLSLKVRISESLFDTDLLQELHALVNLNCSMEMLSSRVRKEAMKEINHYIQIQRDVPQLLELPNFITLDLLQQSNVVFRSEPSTPVKPSLGASPYKQYISPAAETINQCIDLTSDASKATTAADGSRASRILSRISIIQRDFVGNAVDRKVLAFVQWREKNSKVVETEREVLKYSREDRAWWTILGDYLVDDLQFFLGLNDAIDRGEAAYSRLRNFRNVSGLFFLLGQELDALSEARSKAVRAINQLSKMPTEEEIIISSDCQQCRSYFNKTGPICGHCKLFNQCIHPYKYNFLVAARRRNVRVVSAKGSTTKTSALSQRLGGSSDLFSLTAAEEVSTRQFDEGVVDGLYPMVMKLIRSAVNKYRVPELVELSKLEIKWIDEALSEVNGMIAVWDRYSELLKTYDELEQCKSRVQMADSLEEKLQDNVAAERFLPAELDFAYSETWKEAMTANRIVKDSISSLSFFKKQVNDCAADERGGGGVGGGGQEVCGICKEVLFEEHSSAAAVGGGAQAEVIVLPCAHRFHEECGKLWVTTHRKCPYCRTAAQPNEISSVSKKTERSVHHFESKSGDKLIRIDSAGQRETLLDAQFRTVLRKIKGRWGTKVDAVVTDLLSLHRDSSKSSEKFIVFSQWPEMLEIVAEALQANSISCTVCFNRTKDFESASSGIEAFRNDPRIRVLLMPLSLGAEGLDLIVASHVFLLEPLLNKSQELQAINRIDRIGQDKVTFVHKYFVEETIEEKILEFQSLSIETSMGKGTRQRAQIADDHTLSWPDVQFILNLSKSMPSLPSE